MRIKDYTPTRPIILGDFGVTPKVLPKLTEEEILAQQPKSTQAILKGEVKADRPMPEKEAWCAVKDAKSLDEAVNKRFIEPEEEAQYLSHRMNRDHKPLYREDKTALIHPDNHNGDYEYKMLDWKKDLVVSKLAHNMGIFISRTEKENEPKEKQWVEVSAWQAFKLWLKGDKVRLRPKTNRTRPWQE